ncbi:hypothetical protein [Actinocatenispora rupis]|uniref:Lipoprotein n=1 Tax=Actinocatenispora rupis TaxID=519421 RepID=A0A8J3JCS9_9ACTN|nr:hypothetical protein [Actinocatenispora rupis]GID16082.1 hypothetical protein Aru02nite_69710 [Actinocatenispora rupis]
MDTGCRRWGAVGLALGAALLLGACSDGHGRAESAPSHPASASTRPSASPSAACPSSDDILRATGDTAGNDKYQVTKRGVLACERGYAAAEVLYPGAGTNVVVLHLAGGTWRTLIMGSDVCSGDGDDGRTRPHWMVGVPDSVVSAAHCQPDFYRD